ncbi:MAG: elongation factor Ts [Lachnospiraceae bacterium]|nr:elongation factor Ts [Candidatus Equihabitans merdae]
MAITAAMVKELRELSGAGMMDCKRALTETNGDMDEAIDLLRKNGQMKAAKKADRIAAEGICMTNVSEDCKLGVAVEVNAETDFVAKNEKFQTFVAKVAETVVKSGAADMDALMAAEWTYDESATVADALTALIAVIGENMKIRRFQTVKEDNGFVAAYTHMGGKIVTMIDVETDVINDAVAEMGKNIAMQCAAMKPEYCSREEVDDAFIEHEKEILLAQIMNDPKESQKPEKVIQGMIQGRIAKELKDICLLDQIYVKAEDGKQTVQKYVDEVAKANGANIKIKGYVRFETGEGLEKKVEDFAAEVAAQRAKA